MVEPGQLWQTPFATYEVEIVEVYEEDGTCAVRDSDTGKLSVGSTETLEELWVLR